MSAVTLGSPRHRYAGAGAHPGGAVIIGFQDQGNLGMGYLASTLEAHHHPVELVEFRDPVDSGRRAGASRRTRSWWGSR